MMEIVLEMYINGGENINYALEEAIGTRYLPY
jgi:hypothetical protein